MKITALIPARKNSERFPGKNYAIFLGKPLFMHSVQFARESKIITDYFVTSNDDLILKHCENNNIPYIRRPDVYCHAKSKSSSFVKHYLDELIINKIKLPDALLILQPTDPVRKHKFLKEMIQLYHSKTADCVFTVVQCKSKMGEVIDDIFIPNNFEFEQRFQDIKPYYQENGMFYLIKTESFLKYNSFFGKRNIPYTIPEYFKNMDIDTELELKIAEIIFKMYK